MLSLKLIKNSKMIFFIDCLKKTNRGLSKKNKRIIGFAFLFSLFFILGIRIINMDLLYVTIDQVYEYKNRLSVEEVYVSNLKQKLEVAKLKVSEHNLVSQGDEEKKILCQEEINKYKILGGYTSLTGEGVIIVVDDGVRDLIEEEDPLTLIVHDVDVRYLVNELNNAGAEAISINENRILMGVSEVFCNGPTIRINGVQQSRPYVIKAIGDKYKLAKSLLDSESYGVNLMKYGLQYELVTSSNLEVRAYKGSNLFRYASIPEE